MDEPKLPKLLISAHEAQIDNIFPVFADGVRRKDDIIAVWLSFKESVGSILGFGVELPVAAADWPKERFIWEVERLAEMRLARELVQDAQNRIKTHKLQELQERTEKLNETIARLKSRLGVGPDAKEVTQAKAV